MPNAAVSVVMATYERAKYLERSLECYARQNFQDFELIICDDYSTDNTEALVREWSSRLNIIYLRPWYKKPGTWRSEASVINVGLRAASGQLIIATHPEIMVGRDSILRMWEHRKDDIYLACKPYFLTYEQQLALDTVDWKGKGITAVRELPDFYNQHPNISGPSEVFQHRNMEKNTCWDTWQFGGMTRKTWQKHGGFWEFETWGSVDVWWLNARQKHGIKNLTEMEDSTLCIHQFHDNPGEVQTPRDVDKVFKSLVGIPLTANNLW